MSALTTRTITRALTRAVAIAKRVAAGDLSSRIETRSPAILCGTTFEAAAVEVAGVKIDDSAKVAGRDLPLNVRHRPVFAMRSSELAIHS